MRASALTSILVVGTCVAVGGGCIKGFDGSNIQLDLLNSFPTQASSFGPAETGQFEPNSHFTLYGVQSITTGGAEGQALFALQDFELHPIVDLKSPCYIDVGTHVPFPGVHVSQYANMMKAKTGIMDVANPPASATEQDKIDMGTALQRMQNVTLLGASAGGLKAVTSASTGSYPPVAADCTGSDTQIPPPSCTDDASNARRLKLCQAAWAADPNLFEGTDRVLTEPLNGLTYGFLDGTNPTNSSAVGGVQWFVPSAVDRMDGFAIYHVVDNMPAPGTQLFYGTPTESVRGVDHVHLVSPSNPALKAELAIFANLGQDDVHF